MLNRYERFFSFCLSESHFSSLNSFAEEYRLQYSSVNPYIVEEPLRLVLLEPARRHINSMSILFFLTKFLKIFFFKWTNKFTFNEFVMAVHPVLW